MKKVLAIVILVIAFCQIKSQAAVGDLWCVGSATKGSCISSAGYFLPVADGTLDIGSAAKSWRNAYFDGDVTIKNLSVTGTLSPYSTGTFTGESIELDYGIKAATGVFSGAISAASLGTSGAIAADTTVTAGTNLVATAGSVTAGTSVSAGTTVTAGTNLVATAGSVSAATSITAGTHLIATAGYHQLYMRTFAEASSIDPTASGQMYGCSNCVTPVIVSTAAGVVGAFSGPGGEAFAAK